MKIMTLHDDFEDFDLDDEPWPVCVSCAGRLDPDDIGVVCFDCSQDTDRHAAARDNKRDAEHRMVVTGRSTKTVLLPLLGKERKRGK
jgi:hypothetical protein